MKVWLDDVRDPPANDWFWVKTAAEAILLLQMFPVEMISLDHDLGDDLVLGTGCCFARLQTPSRSNSLPEPCWYPKDAVWSCGCQTTRNGIRAKLNASMVYVVVP
jgi:hypothetical protein